MGYGLVKRHKPGMPLRPILSGFQTLTSRAEGQILNFIQSLEKECTFSINSTKLFKSKILELSKNVNFKTFELVSFDCKSMYSNIDVKKAIKILCDKIFIKFKTKDFFPIDPECPKMSRRNFESFLKQLLIDHNYFITKYGQ